MKKEIEVQPKIQAGDNKTYISRVKLTQIVILSRNWIKYKSQIIENPCYPKSASLYPIAKLLDNNNPLALMMPQIHFNPAYNSAGGDSWEELYLNDDIFIAMDELHDKKLTAFSLESIFLANKYNGFLRTTLRYDDKDRTAMSSHDQDRFIKQLEKRYPFYYEEYLDAHPSQDLWPLSKIPTSKLEILLNVLEITLVLSCHKGRLNATTLTGDFTDLLSAFGYELLTRTLAEVFSVEERTVLKKVWAKNIQDQSEKRVGDLIDSAMAGRCTTAIGLYWLGLLKQYRRNFSLTFDESSISCLYDNLIKSNSIDLLTKSKALFSQCLKENLRYIVAELINSQEETTTLSTSNFF